MKLKERIICRIDVRKLLCRVNVSRKRSNGATFDANTVALVLALLLGYGENLSGLPALYFLAH
jgi:hypothetical protein